jgi:type I restriction enzyme R subunit
MAFNEDTRVKIPTILHLTQLGYEYLSLHDAGRASYDASSNIFTEIFVESIERINPDIEDLSAAKIYEELKQYLDYEDLGKKFYERITQETGIKIIDFENFDNNSFNVVTELPCINGDDEFRPDITLLINGLPLFFIEVKKPNNKGGIVAESERMNEKRIPNKKFRRFLNATQIIVFSNNMEYNAEGGSTPFGVTPIQGAFYSTTSTEKVVLNSFKEEDKTIYDKILPFDDVTETAILKDTNNVSIKYNDEYITNRDTLKPTKRIVSSLFQRDRIKELLKYGIAYVRSDAGVGHCPFEKHIMRYPQFFATQAIERHLNNGFKKGIIWHTQGSGKTALAYYNVAHIINHFRKNNIVPKFYFIVDRLDLLTQAQSEFENRGLRVNICNNKEEFKKNIEAQAVITNTDGKNEITVVNIHKFQNESRVVEPKDYIINVQRIYFIDEVHRSYNPHGSFLANLINSDRNAIYIGLTGTPLLKQKISGFGEKKSFDSKEIFCDQDDKGKLLHSGYIHKYYYNNSIEDGYTLKLIREGIETTYKTKLKSILDELNIEKGSAAAKEVMAHKKYVTPLTEYIITDFEKSRNRLDDQSIGGMVVCQSSEQARAIFAEIKAIYTDFSVALILHDSDDKDTLKKNRDDFKIGKIDILVVYNMLLTGFDAKRLKKIYLNRVVKDHNLLQTLTRVNRPYNSIGKLDKEGRPTGRNHQYGFVVDFADIQYEFNKTNQEYLAELQDELGEEMDKYSNLFKSEEDIKAEIAEIKEKLFSYDIENAEKFSEQINEISDKETILTLKKVLENARTLGNLILLYDHDDLCDKGKAEALLDFTKLKILLNEVQNRFDLINQKEALENDDDNTNIINVALEDVIFSFRKISEEELSLGIIDSYKDWLRKTREEMQNNFDNIDPEFISLKEELERLFKKKKLTEEKTPSELESDIQTLEAIYKRIKEQNRKDAMLKAKYYGDEKFARIHKRLLTPPPFPAQWKTKQININEALQKIKAETDDKLIRNNALLNNEPYFAKDIKGLVSDSFDEVGLPLEVECAIEIVKLVVKEYVSAYKEAA